MLDENDETTSVDNDELEVLDGKFASIIEADGEGIYTKVASFIRSNKDIFLN